MAASIGELEVGGEAEAWSALGFAVEGDL